MQELCLDVFYLTKAGVSKEHVSTHRNIMHLAFFPLGVDSNVNGQKFHEISRFSRVYRQYCNTLISFKSRQILIDEILCIKYLVHFLVDVTDTDNVLDGYRLTNPPEPHEVDDLEAGDEYLLADFGYQPLGSIGDFVWFDENADGVQDGGAEVGFGGNFENIEKVPIRRSICLI